MIHHGSCLCGALQFEATADPIDAGYCHCRMCQKLSGASALPWAAFLVNDFRYTKGKPKVYRSSAHGQREFCADCGSQIAFRDSSNEKTVEINVGTMNEPGRFPPRCHIWCDSKVEWFDTDDDLPRYPKSGARDGA
ncbi:MAG: GFA family protein [Gammaproteobacteria bacterium]|nr:GFA family protein [Gammaproteobacteria bacterium]MDH5214737.1 GFA family protein [Gammaproteobacteria bacterium]